MLINPSFLARGFGRLSPKVLSLRPELVERVCSDAAWHIQETSVTPRALTIVRDEHQAIAAVPHALAHPVRDIRERRVRPDFRAPGAQRFRPHYSLVHA
ncbi:MAG TPA: hypothetical protein VKD22_11805 [Ramlibacter sp.]|nr:hypothetical protein [Ramlibacter sp.]